MSSAEAPTLDIDQLYAELGVTVAHPVLPLPERQLQAELLRSAEGREQLAIGLKQREELIQLMEHDPLRHGYELPWWTDARRLLAGTYPGVGMIEELLVLGGNDSAKSWFLAKLGVEALVKQPGIEYLFGHNTEASSINQQQKIVYRFLPPEWRDLGKRGKHVDVTFHDHSGFKENKFSLPNGSHGYFFFWKQLPGDLAGYKATGASGDELITIQHLEELRTRMLGRGGKLIVGFTPQQGYSPPVAHYLAGARVVETRPAAHLPARNFDNRPDVPDGHMPYILQCRLPSAAVIFAFTEWSPFRKPGELERMIDGKNKDYVKIRAYGWTDKSVGNAFPRFSEMVNVIVRNKEHPWSGNGVVPPKPWLARGGGGVSEYRSIGAGAPRHPDTPTPRHNSSPALYPRLPAEGSNYCVADPGGNKNWFIKWYRAGIEPEWTFVYREWPPASTHGAWAEPNPSQFRANQATRWDGYPGPAQRYDFDPSILRYKKLILEAEGWLWVPEEGGWNGDNAEEITERLIDPRMGGAEVPSAEEGTSIIELMADEQFDAEGRLQGPSMIWVPAPGGGRSIANMQSLELFNDRLQWDSTKPLTALNCPRWYVVDACEQSIYAYREYTGLDGEKGALKDVVDPDWYYVKAECGYASELVITGAGDGGEDE